MPVSGVFHTVTPCTCGLDLLELPVGTYVDSDFLGAGSLQRLLMSRSLRRVGGPTLVTAA